MDSRSPSEVMADPASMTLTPSSSSFVAMSTLSLLVSATPGVCSPSLRVVSKNRTFSNNIIPHDICLSLSSNSLEGYTEVLYMYND